MEPSEVTQRGVSRRQLLFASSAAAVAGMLAACQPVAPTTSAEQSSAGGTAPTAAPPSGSQAQIARGTLVAAMEADTGTLDGNLVAGSSTNRALIHLYDRFVERDLLSTADTPPLVPGLALSWDISPDATVYTFKLRQGVKFHDGSPFNADAAKFVLERNYKQDHPFFFDKSAATTRAIFGDIARTEAVDPQTLRVTLKTPSVEFLSQLTLPWASIPSPEAIRRVGNEQYGQQPSGTGPFRYVEWQKGTKLELQRNPDYWNGAPSIERLFFRPIIESLARVVALQRGEADFAVPIDPDQVDLVRSNANLRLVANAIPHTWWISFNTRDRYFSNRTVRQAISYAINRDALANQILKGTAVPAQSMLGPGNSGYDKTLKGYQYDPAKAKQLLADAGYPNGFATNWIFPTSGGGSMTPVPMFEYIQRDLRDVGVQVSLKSYEFQAYLPYVTTKGVPDDVGAMWMGTMVSEPFALKMFLGTASQVPNGLNHNRYSNKQFDDLLAQAEKTVDRDARLKLYHNAERLMLDDAPMAFVVHDTMPKGYSKKLQNFVVPHDAYFTFRSVTLAG